eukprot:6214625-Pleurochrysis_carterae.AAC.1
MRAARGRAQDSGVVRTKLVQRRQALRRRCAVLYEAEPCCRCFQGSQSVQPVFLEAEAVTSCLYHIDSYFISDVLRMK